MTISRPPAAISAASTWTWLRTMSASYSGRIAASSSRVQPMRSSTSCLAREEVDALPRDRLGDEDPHAPVPATVKLAMPSRASAARWAAATAAPGSTGRPCWSETISSVLERAEDLLERDGAQVADAEDLAGELALTARQHDAAPLDLGVEGLPVEAIGHGRGRDRPRVVALVGEQLEAERRQAGAGGGGTCLVPGEDRRRALVLHEPEALVDLVDDRDRRRPRRLPSVAASRWVRRSR